MDRLPSKSKEKLFVLTCPFVELHLVKKNSHKTRVCVGTVMDCKTPLSSSSFMSRLTDLERRTACSVRNMHPELNIFLYILSCTSDLADILNALFDVSFFNR